LLDIDSLKKASRVKHNNFNLISPRAQIPIDDLMEAAMSPRQAAV